MESDRMLAEIMKTSCSSYRGILPAELMKKRGLAIIPVKCSVRYPKTFYYQVIFRNASKSENNFLRAYNKRSIDTTF